MIDFAASIRNGIENATTAAGDRKEIQNLFIQLDTAIRSATFGNGKLFVGPFVSPDGDDVMRLSSVTHRLVIQSTEDERDGRIMAGWETSSEGGFAVRLVYDNQHIYCENSEELAEELGNLLETVRVGRAIQYFADR